MLDRIQLLERGRFTFGEWLDTFDYDFVRAMNELTDVQLDPESPVGVCGLTLEQLAVPVSDQIWDGWFELYAGLPCFAGADAPQGGTGVTRRRRIYTTDVIIKS
jgi:hypothetical protein